MKPKAAWCLGFFGALTFYWLAMTLGGFDWSSHWKLARTAAETDAIVMAIEPDNHCKAYYEFSVADQRYQGSGSACSVGLGDKLHVYYLPSKPSFSTLKEPGSDLIFVIVAPLFLSTVAGFIVMFRLGRRRE